MGNESCGVCSMADKSMGIIGTVVSTLAGAAALSLATWAGFDWTATIAWLTSAGRSLWHQMIIPVPIPRVLLVAIVLAVGWAFSTGIRRLRHLTPRKRPLPQDIYFTPEQNHVLSCLFRIGVSGASVDRITQESSGVPEIVIEHAARELQRRGFVDVSYQFGVWVSLTPRGVSF